MPKPQQLKYLPKLLDKRDKVFLSVGSVIFILALGTLFVRLWIQNTVPVPKVGGVYTEGLIGSPRFINPLLAPGNDVDRDLTSLVFSGLMKIDADGRLVPDLAENVTINEGQTVYTIKLRNDVLWHDEKSLTTDDVLFTIKTIQDPIYKSPLRVSFSGVVASKIDDRTLSLTLREPFPAFLSALTVGIIPEHIWYSIPTAQASLAEVNIKPIGSGPYRFNTLTKDSNGVIHTITLTRNENYYAVMPYIADLSFRFYPDTQTAIEALTNKNIDGLGSLPLKFIPDLEQNKTIELKPLGLPQYNALFFNPLVNEILQDKTVRIALTHAIDRERIIQEVLQGNGNRINTVLIPGFVGDTSKSDVYYYDAARAAEILDERGWAREEGATIRTKDEEELHITLTSVDQPENVNTLAIIKENWEALGIKTDIVIVSRDKIRKDVIEPRAYEVLLFGQIISSSQNLYAFWHSSQNVHPGNNLSVLANKDIDLTLEKLRNTLDIREQAKLLQQFQDKLADELFAIFLYNPNYIYPINKKLRGTEDLKRISVPSDRFNTISDWYVETSRRLR